MAAKKKFKKDVPPPPAEWPFGTKNYILFGIALVIIVVGYICLGYGDDPNAAITLTVAPILLVIGYALIPFAIMARDKKDESEVEAESDSEEE